jgi:hypothetical protein
MAIDDLSGAARQIAGGDFAWRTPVRSNDQIGELAGLMADGRLMVVGPAADSGNTRGKMTVGAPAGFV